LAGSLIEVLVKEGLDAQEALYILSSIESYIMKIIAREQVNEALKANMGFAA
jgi:hypothetical protein